MTELDKKINEYFAGLVVRKDLVKTVKGNAIVPTYVLEYLLGQYCASDDEATIISGIDTVKDILAKHYVHRNESTLIRSTIKERGQHRVIDKIAVTLNDKKDVYEAQFSNLGLKEVLLDSDTVKAHPKCCHCNCALLNCHTNQ
jgi:ATP-dependent Lon protease